MNEHFSTYLADMLGQKGVDPRSLKIEIVESSVIGNFSVAARQIKALRRLWLHIALDDFGTGYSSLEYLNQLEFDLIKIDKTFVDGIEIDERKKSMVRMIFAVSGILGSHVCVEGVETQEQAEIAREFEAQLGQGYLYATPMPFSEICGFLGQPA